MEDSWSLQNHGGRELARPSHHMRLARQVEAQSLPLHILNTHSSDIKEECHNQGFRRIRFARQLASRTVAACILQSMML